MLPAEAAGHLLAAGHLGREVGRLGLGDSEQVDRLLLTQPVVWTGGGSETHLVRLEPAELVRLARAEPMDVVELHT